ncbi:GNAT family N-acetyltransferase [Desulfolutivibrio sulfoxidireducens]|uniref:GNAT family N-acetyltransferase n=1 Tax=Desulfolutivibrio sulfoxidireducens TaxID=2773299 RepID=UPI001FE472CD|nr:GNAT family N-acetyltransferase [Desulfolutivibrio sulfoxidireducens]
MESSPRIRDAAGETDLRAARELFREYAASLDFGLEFQNFEEELAGLPGRYARPGGCLLVAEARIGPVRFGGCVALRGLEPGVCEMKRLFVRPWFRGQGLGRRLAEAVIARARLEGYARMRLDTIATMVQANGLYLALGFAPIPAYCENPIPGARFYELRLSSAPE